MSGPSRFGRPDWVPVPREGCINVESRMIMVDERLGVAMLRFSPGATIDEHAAPHDIDVVCLEGAGYTSVDGERWVLHEGQVIRWPRERRHRLWTEQSSMITLMLERLER